MSSTTDKFKGRLLEALGALADDDSGDDTPLEQMAGKAKMVVDGVTKKAQFASDQAIENAPGMAK